MRRVEQCVKQKVGNCCENTSPKCPHIFSCFIVPHSLPRLHKKAVRFGFYSQGHTTVMATVPVPKKNATKIKGLFILYQGSKAVSYNRGNLCPQTPPVSYQSASASSANGPRTPRAMSARLSPHDWSLYSRASRDCPC